MTPHYELFDHTADLGVRVRAPSLAELVPPATEAFYAVIGDVVTSDAARPWTLELRGDDPAVLLRDYLAELLHAFECGRRRLTDVHAGEFTSERLVVSGQMRATDPTASDFEREIKAVTYHELAIRPIADGYEATYIVDI